MDQLQPNPWSFGGSYLRLVLTLILLLADMATTDLKLDEPGSLPKPGPVGRFVRLAFGALCLWYVISLLQVTGNLFGSDGHIKSIIWNGIIIGLFLVSYVVNIGFSKAWKKWPAIISACILLLIAAAGYFVQGHPSLNLGRAIKH